MDASASIGLIDRFGVSGGKAKLIVCDNGVRVGPRTANSRISKL